MKPTKKQIAAVMREIGRNGWSKGGHASAQRLTPEERSARARRAVMARWARREVRVPVTDSSDS